ncbi:ABC transporter permease [Microlunatus parietis]|uniref:ABC-2 type transport system permease protein n=1 Tax=Microlunatus parietis TaxID=682979 RepID=A0A7Y9I7A8_9ACTN|nr:ABC transporter permease [Microlunatus parietis]NYE71604.1 ABC-2 type transport system permease protein [Microlunatus parietis]
MIIGTGQLVRLHLRRDRVLLAVWVLTLGLLPAAMVSATRVAYPTSQDMINFAAVALASPAQLATRGPVFAATLGGLVAWTVASSGALVQAVATILITVRHTRADEQSGRQETLSTTAIGRLAPLAAAISVSMIGNVAVGLVAALGLLAQGQAPVGSLLIGAVFAGTGLFFTGVTALIAQLAQSGAAYAISLSVLGVSFALAAAGDLTRSWLVWLSPIGWARHAEAFAGDHAWAPLLPAAGGVLTMIIAARFALIRDLGAGLIPPRPGRARASALLSSPLGLAWRRHRSGLAAWAVGLGMLGLLLGSVTQSLDAQLDTPAFQQLSAAAGGGSVSEVFFRFIVYVLAQVATAAALATVLSLHGDERSGLAEPILVTRTSRPAWAFGEITMAALTGAAVLAAIGLAAGLTSGTGPALAAMTLGYLPSVLIMIGLAVALTGWLPRAAAPVCWTGLGLLLVLDLLGEFRLVPEQVLWLSPYALTFGGQLGRLPLVPALAGLTGLAVLLTGIGIAGLRRRDLSHG